MAHNAYVDRMVAKEVAAPKEAKGGVRQAEASQGRQRQGEGRAGARGAETQRKQGQQEPGKTACYMERRGGGRQKVHAQPQANTRPTKPEVT